MKLTTMHIAFNLDNNYAPHCATVIRSVVEHNRGEHICFHLVSADLSTENKRKIGNWVVSLDGNYEIFFYDIDGRLFDNFPLGDAYLNITCYYRLLIPNLLENVDKVLYLDCDVIVMRSLRDLWNTDLGDKEWAGVRDRTNDYVRVYNRLGYPMSCGYMNDGVMLMNLKRLREDDVFEKAKNVAAAKPLALKNHEQDILNLLYCDNKLVLPFRYNLLEYYLYVEEWLYMDRKYYAEIIEACRRPVIVHFCMPQKPWHVECINPYRELYYRYRRETPWPDLRLTHKQQHLSTKQRLKLLLERLGLYHVERKPTLRGDIGELEDPRNVLF